MVVEERFPKVAWVGIFLGEDVDEVGIVKVNFVDLPETTDTAGGVAELPDEAGFFNVQEIIAKIVAAHANDVGQFLYYRFEGNALGDND